MYDVATDIMSDFLSALGMSDRFRLEGSGPQSLPVAVPVGPIQFFPMLKTIKANPFYSRRLSFRGAVAEVDLDGTVDSNRPVIYHFVLGIVRDKLDGVANITCAVKRILVHLADGTQQSFHDWGQVRPILEQITLGERISHEAV